MLVVGGCTERCLLNSECGEGEVCLEGRCLTRCKTDQECPQALFCLSGGCQVPDPEARPVCRDDAGCVDAAVEPEGDAAFADG
ncbi:MAG: hypothetical protein KC620_24145, partial [Myxococcales bacterium]|nr:hypothetical protein [Myxococcales bacterium]